MLALEVNHINKAYGSHKALSDVSLSMPESCIYGLLGPNGAGKTSLIRIINQITAPDEGEVIFFGEALKAEHVHQIGYLPEERGLYRKMKIGDQAMYLAQLKGMSKADAKRELKTWFDRLDIGDWWNKKVEELSKGMAQKVQFISTVLHKPRLLILDEPFSGFDPINAAVIRQEILRLRDEGASIILSTHNMASVEEICDNITLIHQSHVVIEGEVNEVRNRYAQNEFEIEFKGSLIGFTTGLGPFFHLVSTTGEANHHRAIVKLGEGRNLNDLLKSVIDTVDIQEVKPRVPSMNEIFISAVSNVKEGL